MLELNKEYTYKEICSVLGWKESTGNQKIKQIKEIESSYEFFHPENKKTHKPKKSYIFTKQLKEPVIVDKRKNNGAENLFPEEDFEYLFKCMLQRGTWLDFWHQRGQMNEVYVSQSIIYITFLGRNLYTLIDGIRYVRLNKDDKPDYLKAMYVFRNICMDAAKSNTVTRICKKMHYKKNVMPKGILRHENSKDTHTVPDNELLETYQTRMGELLQEYRVGSELQAIQRGCYFDILLEIQIWFEEELEKYGVKRYNLITIEDMSEIEEFIPEREKTEELQKKMLCVIVESIIKSVRNRCTEAKTYKIKLKPEEKILLGYYLTDLLKETELIKDYAGQVVEIFKIVREQYPDVNDFIEEMKKKRKAAEEI